MTRFAPAAALIAALLPAAAMADTIRLEAPLAGATLHDAGIDMSAYYTPRADGTFETVAAYVTASDPADVQHLYMALADGDAVTFALPGEPGTHFGFVREGDTVQIHSEPAPRTVADAR